jgi:hypothetical protein
MSELRRQKAVISIFGCKSNLNEILFCMAETKFSNPEQKPSLGRAQKSQERAPY